MMDIADGLKMVLEELRAGGMMKYEQYSRLYDEVESLRNEHPDDNKMGAACSGFRGPWIYNGKEFGKGAGGGIQHHRDGEMKDEERANGTGTEIKPCPFCGGKAELFAIPMYFKRGLSPVGWTVKCLNRCCKQEPYMSDHDAVEAWNRRAEHNGQTDSF